MVTVTGSFECIVKAPAEVAYSYVADPDKVPIWRSYAVEVRPADGTRDDTQKELSAGARYIIRYQRYTKQFQDEFEVEQAWKGELFRARRLNHALNFHEEVLFSRKSRSTKITYTQSVSSTNLVSSVVLLLFGWARRTRLKKNAKRHALRLATGLEVRPADEQAKDEY